MLISIYDEKTKCLFHCNDAIALKIEKLIISDAIIFLQNEKYKIQKIEEINNILLNEKTINYVNTSPHGSGIIIEYDIITTITDLNILPIMLNFDNIIKLYQFQRFFVLPVHIYIIMFLMLNI